MGMELRSKLIDAASYKEDKRLLRIYMANGQLREFVGVPRQVFNVLAQAVSAGTYYVQNIKGRFAGGQ